MVSPAYVKKLTGVRNEDEEESGNRMSSFNNAVSASSQTQHRIEDSRFEATFQIILTEPGQEKVVQRILFEKMGVIYVFNPNLISNPNPRNMTWQLCLSLAYAIRQALNCITLYQNIIF